MVETCTINHQRKIVQTHRKNTRKFWSLTTFPYTHALCCKFVLSKTVRPTTSCLLQAMWWSFVLLKNTPEILPHLQFILLFINLFSKISAGSSSCHIGFLDTDHVLSGHVMQILYQKSFESCTAFLWTGAAMLQCQLHFMTQNVSTERRNRGILF